MANLPTCSLGRSGPAVTAVGFGLMGLSTAYGAVESDLDRFKVLDRAFQLGEKFWDTADVYGDNEDLLGKWFKRTGKRNEIFLATKFGCFPNPDGTLAMRSDPQYIKEACAKSLSRLGSDFIDLYYCHRVDGKTPIEETIKAMVELKNEGRIRYLGLSEVSSATLRRAYAVHPICAVQVEYSPFALEIENPDIGLLSTCRELGVAVVAYSPLGRGLMTGTYKSPDDFEEGDFRRLIPRYSKENFPKNLKLVKELEAIAKKKECTAGQLTIAWLMKQGEYLIPIPGTKKIKYLEENIGALNVKLTDEENKEIRNAVDNADVHGQRYPEFMIQGLFGDTPILS